MRILENLAQDICCAIEHGEALYEKEMFDSLISDIQRLVDECHREFLKNQEENESEEDPVDQVTKVVSLEKANSDEPGTAKVVEPEKSMKILVVYKGTGCTGTVPVNVDRDEISFEDFEAIQNNVRAAFKDESIIITNMIKLPFK